MLTSLHPHDWWRWGISAVPWRLWALPGGHHLWVGARVRATPDEPREGAGSCGTAEQPHIDPAHPKPARKEDSISADSKGLKPNTWDQVTILKEWNLETHEPRKYLRVLTTCQALARYWVGGTQGQNTYVSFPWLMVKWGKTSDNTEITGWMITNCDKYKEGKSRGKCKGTKGRDLHHTNCWEGFSEEVTSIRRHKGWGGASHIKSGRVFLELQTVTRKTQRRESLQCLEN